MQPEEVQKAVDGALKWADDQMMPADLVAVAAISSTLQVLTDFTSEQAAQCTRCCRRLPRQTARRPPTVDASTMATDEAANSAATDDSTALDASAQELDSFNNDVRLRGAEDDLRTASADSAEEGHYLLQLGHAAERHRQPDRAARGRERSRAGEHRRSTLSMRAAFRRWCRAAAARKAAAAASRVFRERRRAAVRPARGAAGDADVAGLRHRRHGVHRLERLRRSVLEGRKDISSYYILGFASTNTNKDGRYPPHPVSAGTSSNAQGQAREGYYADRDFAHTAKADRESAAAGAAGDADSGHRRSAVRHGRMVPARRADKYYVPISVAVPGSAVPAVKGQDDARRRRLHQGRARASRSGRIRDTLTVPPERRGARARQILYQTGVTLPPGRFTAKIVVRENADGQMGTFETPITVPELKRAPVKVSSVVLGTQLQNVAGRKTVSPLVRDGVELVPNLTHIVSHDQKLYFYYEVYDPAAAKGDAGAANPPDLLSRQSEGLRDARRRAPAVDAADRHAAVFQFEVPAESFKPGLYTCQVSMIDAVAGRFAFPRLQMYVR